MRNTIPNIKNSLGVMSLSNIRKLTAWESRIHRVFILFKVEFEAHFSWKFGSPTQPQTSQSFQAMKAARRNEIWKFAIRSLGQNKHRKKLFFLSLFSFLLLVPLICFILDDFRAAHSTYFFRFFCPHSGRIVHSRCRVFIERKKKDSCELLLLLQNTRLDFFVFVSRRRQGKQWKNVFQLFFLALHYSQTKIRRMKFCVLLSWVFKQPTEKK